ncbi:HD domain-containing phosphohydrolase [Desulfobacula sp.]|uniref:HD domain-containing phosphohydrolase n=1 Tax=Desulfobacula sp. TaxID=2593537 RepID=UPI001EB37B30|nr:two-component system response regulator [Desulfobacula sp.]
MEKKSLILVVDDEDRNRRLMEALLVPLGYEVIFASDGHAALQKVNDTPPDVILLDIMMPGLNGFEVAKKLKADEKTRIIPVVMVTMLQDVESRIKSLEAGADDFLSKPVDASELKARVSSSLQVKAYHDHMRNYQKELETAVAKRTEELRQAFEAIKTASLDTIYRLSRASEYKDEDTGAHIKRMCSYSAAVAHQMGLGKDEVENIRYAAPMHDAGKIGIPDKVLLKPGKLDPGEWKTMKQHTSIGGKILGGSDSEYIKRAEVIALTHHEKWDGSGYPRGLKGTDIPLAGRITAIADVFDALMSKRPYKEPFSLEKSFAIIQEGKGSHFDPEVVEAFFAIEKEILVIKETFRDEAPSLFIQMRT